MMRYPNWNESYSVDVERIERPGCLREVQDVVREARRRGKHVKAIGAGHSFNDVGMCEDILVDMSRLKKITLESRRERRVRVGAGVPLKRLVRWLEKRKLALPNIGAWMEQTVAGVVSTATHGSSGKWRKTLIGAVEEIRLVDGKAKARVLKGDDLKFLTLGFFGIITEVVFRCEPLFWLHQTNTVVQGERAIRGLETYLAQHDLVDLRWVGNSTKVIVRCWDKVDRPPGSVDWAMRSLEGAKLRALNEMLTVLRVPAWRESNARLLFGLLGQAYVRSGGWFDSTSIWYEALTFNSLGVAAPHQERELAFPRDRAVECLLALRQRMLQDRRSASLEIQVRFSPAIDVLMAPAHRRETVWFNLNMLAPGYTETLVEDLTELARQFDPRPHWAKSLPGKNPWMKELFAGDARAWEKVRRRYDPDGHFLNDWYHRHIGLAPRSLPEWAERD